MKVNNTRSERGFTLSEMLVALAVGSVALTAIMSVSIALQKSLNAVDNYFSAHVQEIRIVDYLSRDVKRSYIVTSVANPQTVTCTIPNYVVQPTDADYNGSNTNARRTPKITKNAGGIMVNYGARNVTTVTDAVMTSGSATLTSNTASFTAGDVGSSIAGTGIPPGTIIQAYTNATTVTMSNSATASGSGMEVTIGASTVVYSVSGQSILRTENGALTTIASSTDNLLPSYLDITLANTEYLTTSITFLPIFTSNDSRSGTTIYSTAHLRNKRRG